MDNATGVRAVRWVSPWSALGEASHLSVEAAERAEQMGDLEAAEYEALKAMLMAAFAMESLLNDLARSAAEIHCSDPDAVYAGIERMSLRQKCSTICAIAGDPDCQPDYGGLPFQALPEMTRFRNMWVHGKPDKVEAIVAVEEVRCGKGHRHSALRCKWEKQVSAHEARRFATAMDDMREWLSQNVRASANATQVSWGPRSVPLIGEMDA